MNIEAAQEIARDNIELLKRKSEDYGPLPISLVGLPGIAVYLLAKSLRLHNLIFGIQGMGTNILSSQHQPTTLMNRIPTNETLDDTLRDIFNYALIGKMLLDGSWPSFDMYSKIIKERKQPDRTVKDDDEWSKWLRVKANLNLKPEEIEKLEREYIKPSMGAQDSKEDSGEAGDVGN